MFYDSEVKDNTVSLQYLSESYYSTLFTDKVVKQKMLKLSSISISISTQLYKKNVRCPLYFEERLIKS